MRLKTWKVFLNHNKRQGKGIVRNIPAVITKRRSKTTVPANSYKHKEVPLVCYDLSSLFLSNVASLCNKFDEVAMTVESFKVDIVTIIEP